MHKKAMSILSILSIFILFGISLFCIFDGTSASAEKKDITLESSNDEDISKTVYVDIKGAVNNPGVYEVDYGSRIIDVIMLAGDLREDADTSIINLSKKVTDEMYIIVYTKDEMAEYKEKLIPAKTIVKEIEKKIICPDSNNDACINKTSSNNSSKININTASKEELITITGLGEGKASKIIEYRNNNQFESIEDIKNVSGIGDSLYEKIKDYIEV